MIRLEGLVKSYSQGRRGHPGTPALQGIDLSINKGEIFGVIGHSGAGKSTLVRCINLLERPTAGKVYVDGVELTALNNKQLQEARRKIGMIFQHFNLLSSATVVDNIAFPMRLARKPKEEIKARIRELLALVGLEEHADKYPAQLSGGQKQRVGIARALANNPEVLLCDEATSALDPQTTQSILDLLLDINRKLGITIVMITHEMHVIRAICDRVAVIDGGRIVESGKVTDVFLKPQHPVTREFVEQVADTSLSVNLNLNGTSGKRHLYRITYLGPLTYQPILYECARKTGTAFTILQGTISKMKETPYGQLIVQFDGPDEQVQSTIRALQSQGLETEAI